MAKKQYAIRVNDPFKREIEWRLAHGEKPYSTGHEPHILAGDSYLLDDGHGVVTVVHG